MLMIDFPRFSDGGNKNLHIYDMKFNPIETHKTSFLSKEELEGTKYISTGTYNKIIIMDSKQFK